LGAVPTVEIQRPFSRRDRLLLGRPLPAQTARRPIDEALALGSRDIDVLYDEAVV
jgi:hypothetical protein